MNNDNRNRSTNDKTNDKDDEANRGIAPGDRVTQPGGYGPAQGAPVEPRRDHDHDEADQRGNRQPSREH